MGRLPILSDIAPRVPGRADFPSGPTIRPVAKVNTAALGEIYPAEPSECQQRASEVQLANRVRRWAWYTEIISPARQSSVVGDGFVGNKS